MSRDPRVGVARALHSARMDRVTGLRRSLPTQVAHGPSGPSETVRKRTEAIRAWARANGLVVRDA